MNNDHRPPQPQVSSYRTTDDSMRSLLYLDVASVGGSQVRHCAAVDGHHGDGGDQGVGELFVPVLQPLDKLGYLQAVHALLPLVDLMLVAVI